MLQKVMYCVTSVWWSFHYTAGLFINGLLVVIDSIKKSKCKKMVYVSCNPKTLVSNLKELEPYYQICDCSLVEMFPFTSHLETIISLTRKQ